MFKLKMTGPWRQFLNLMASYPRRMRYIENRIGLDLAEAFLKKIKDGIPLDDEYRAYADSLTIIEVIGGRRPTFAVISDRDKVKLGEIKNSSLLSKTVVYIYPSNTEIVSAVVELLVEGNPWPVDMVPVGVPKKEVSLIHRTVTEGEASWARERIKEMIRKYKAEFRRYGVHWGKEVNDETTPDGLESMPDYMSLAVRAEFGINANPSPHWRPAMKWVLKNMKDILEKDDKIKLALHDSVFREHTMAFNSGKKKVSIKDFKKEAGVFEKKVVNS